MCFLAGDAGCERKGVNRYLMVRTIKFKSYRKARMFDLCLCFLACGVPVSILDDCWATFRGVLGALLNDFPVPKTGSGKVVGNGKVSRRGALGDAGGRWGKRSAQSPETGKQSLDERKDLRMYSGTDFDTLAALLPQGAADC